MHGPWENEYQKVKNNTKGTVRYRDFIGATSGFKMPLEFLRWEQGSPPQFCGIWSTTTPYSVHCSSIPPLQEYFSMSLSPGICGYMITATTRVPRSDERLPSFSLKSIIHAPWHNTIISCSGPTEYSKCQPPGPPCQGVVANPDEHSSYSVLFRPPPQPPRHETLLSQTKNI